MDQTEPTRPVSKPIKPLAKTKKARVDAFHNHYLSLTVVDGLTSEQALQVVLDEAVPDDTEQAALTPGQRIVAWLIVGIIAAILLPMFGWAVGYWLFPLWYWGFGWM
jgi:hypothetical protein